MASRSLKAGLAGLLDRGVPPRSVHLAIGERVEPVDFARAAQLDQGHDFLVAGLEADGGSRRHIEPHSPGLGPLEAEGAIHLEEVKVGPDLYGPVGRIRHGQLDGAPAGIGLDVALTEDVLAWDHSKPSRPPDDPLTLPPPPKGG